MEIEEVDMESMPKKHKIEQGQQLVVVKKSNTKGKMKKKNMEKKQKQEEPDEAKLQIQEYVFDGPTPNRHASKEDWLGSYQERDDKNFKETVELYNEAMQLPYPNMALKVVRDHATDTLSLALMMGNKVLEVNVNLAKVPTTDIIHLNK